MANMPPCAGDRQLGHALSADLRPERAGEAHALALEIRREGGGVDQVEQPHDVQRSPLHLLGLGGRPPSPTTLGRASLNRSRLGSVMRMRGMSSPAPAGAGWARATRGERQRQQQVDSADSRTGRRMGPPGRFIGSSVSPSCSLLPANSIITPFRYIARRAGGGGGTCPVARTAVMRGVVVQVIARRLSQLRRFQRAVGVHADHHLRDACPTAGRRSAGPRARSSCA